MSWMRGIGGAMAIGLAWAAAWAPLAVVVGLTLIDPDDSMDEMWVAVGAYPGFLCGVLFTALRAATGRGRGLEELPLPRLAALGAVAGVVVGLIPFTIGDYAGRLPLWQLASAVMAAFTLLSAASAAATGAVVRAVRGRRVQRG